MCSIIYNVKGLTQSKIVGNMKVFVVLPWKCIFILIIALLVIILVIDHRLNLMSGRKHKTLAVVCTNKKISVPILINFKRM